VARRPTLWASRAPAARLLWPLSRVFGALTALRRALYRWRLRRSVRLPVPVIVVGNLAVGGSGKTPVVVALAHALQSAGYRPGIIARGYGANVVGVHEVLRGDVVAECGDEPLLLARSGDWPVVIGVDRPAAGRHLLDRHPECDVLISDDGLQHYRLERDIEIAVVDELVMGNGWLLPAGPLREPLTRLREVSLILAHGALSPALRERVNGRPVFPMGLEGEHFCSLATGQCVPTTFFGGRRVHAFAGIGRPARFFSQLREMGLDVVPHPFPDHHAFEPRDLAVGEGEPKVMTSKDAVKCAAFATEEMWEFPVTAKIDPSAWQHILEMLKKWKLGC